MASNTIEDLLIITQIPYAYRIFKSYKGKLAPKPPYLVYYIERENYYGSDDKVSLVSKDVILVLYTEKKDIVSEKRVQEALSGYEYEKEEDYLETEGLYQVTYKFNLVEKL